MEKEIVIIGAGPAGLTAAYTLTQQGQPCLVLEADPEYVGGISRTVQYKGYRFDLGGHRFFSKNSQIEDLWREILPDNFREVERLSRIYYNGVYFHYPLRAGNALKNLGVLTAAACFLSYVYRKMFPLRPEKSFRDWVTNRFGDRLFQIFFESYTEKVWGMDCDQISADWAAQRIKGLSLMEAVLNMARVGPFRRDRNEIKTLIERFHYPRLGPGMMWEAAEDKIRNQGGTVLKNRKVVTIRHDGDRITGVACANGNGKPDEYAVRSLISSMPLREFVLALDPPAPEGVRSMASSLHYRDFLIVALVVSRRDCFPDNWIYIHDSRVKLGRVQNFRNWSEAMVPDPDVSVLGLEYFCFEGDDLWNMPDEELLELGKKEIGTIGLVRPEEVLEGTVVRIQKAYPVYDDTYRENVEGIRQHLSRFNNLFPAGRNGMHKYNNQDHSMMTAIVSAGNLQGSDHRDPWKVNTDAEYHEEGPSDEAAAS